MSGRVFIVHGPCRELLAQAKDLLCGLGLEPVVLSELPRQGETIIE